MGEVTNVNEMHLPEKGGLNVIQTQDAFWPISSILRSCDLQKAQEPLSRAFPRNHSQLKYFTTKEDCLYRAYLTVSIAS